MMNAITIAWPASQTVKFMAGTIGHGYGFRSRLSQELVGAGSCAGAHVLRSALRADQVAHRRHVGRVAREAQAAQVPAVLDCAQHRVVVVGNVRGTSRVVGMRDFLFDDTATT